MPKRKSPIVQISLDTETIKKLDKIASEIGGTQSSVGRMLVLLGLKHYKGVK